MAIRYIRPTLSCIICLFPKDPKVLQGLILDMAVFTSNAMNQSGKLFFPTPSISTAPG